MTPIRTKRTKDYHPAACLVEHRRRTTDIAVRSVDALAWLACASFARTRSNLSSIFSPADLGGDRSACGSALRETTSGTSGIGRATAIAAWKTPHAVDAKASASSPSFCRLRLWARSAVVIAKGSRWSAATATNRAIRTVQRPVPQLQAFAAPFRRSLRAWRAGEPPPGPPACGAPLAKKVVYRKMSHNQRKSH